MRRKKSLSPNQIIEILEMIRRNYVVDIVDHGLCYYLNGLYFNDKINVHQTNAMFDYFELHKPSSVRDDSNNYWWPLDDHRERISWLSDRINKEGRKIKEKPQSITFENQSLEISKSITKTNYSYNDVVEFRFNDRTYIVPVDILSEILKDHYE